MSAQVDGRKLTFGTPCWCERVNPFSATRHDSCHQNKVRVRGLGGNSSYLAGFFFFFHGSMIKFNQWTEKKLLKISLA